MAHADESGLRVRESCISSGHPTDPHVVRIHARRGWEAIEAHGILPKRIAVLVHDCWKPYWQLDCVLGLCNAHLLRELVFLLESTGQAWNKRMIDLLLDANKACEAAGSRMKRRWRRIE